MTQTEKAIVLVDGEHYPPVIARAIAQLRDEGREPVMALMVGGKEKLGQGEIDLGIPLEWAGVDPLAALAAAIENTGANKVIDIADEPVMDYKSRCRMISVALWKGADYEGADFEFHPPHRPNLAKAASVAVIGTGKRSGKTAIGGAVARSCKQGGLNPVVVAMGRGGPPEPEVMIQEQDVSPRALMDLALSGRHASSDYIEDALTARVPSVGAWRAGGGLAGGTRFGNYPAALEEAAKLDPGIIIMEGSGTALPPAKWDSSVLVVDTRIDPEHLCGYLGLYRLLLADLIVLTMYEETIDAGHRAAVERCIRSNSLSQPKIVRCIFRPFPLGEISGKKIWFATTASEKAQGVLKQHLEQEFGSTVVGMSHALADRDQLRKDLRGAHGADGIAVELKAAAVDLVTRYGIENEIEVIYIDNRPEPVSGENDAPPGASLDQQWLELASLATARFSKDKEMKGARS